MSDAYAQLFQQLYQNKFFMSKIPKNSIERVKLLQRKIKASKSSKKIDSIHKIIPLNDPLTSSQDILDSPTRIMRFTQGRCKIIKLINQGNSNHNPEQERNKRLGNSQKNINSSISKRKNVQTHRTTQDKMNASPQPRKYSLLKYQDLQNLTVDMKNKNRNGINSRNSSKHPEIASNKGGQSSRGIYSGENNRGNIRTPNNNETLPENKGQFQRAISSSQNRRKHVKTPSKNVYIGGHDLEKQGQLHRQAIKKWERELEIYQRDVDYSMHNQITAIPKRRKTIRYEKMQNNKPYNETSKQKRINNVSVNNSYQKQSFSGKQADNMELLPWALIPEHEFY